MSDSKTTLTRDVPLPDRKALQALSDWIIDQGLTANSLPPVMAGVGERVAALGLPLYRLHVSIATLHPTFSGFGGSWVQGRGFNLENYERSQETNDQWQRSPLRALIDSGQPTMRRRLEGPDAAMDFPVLREFQAQGGTDWYAQAVRFGGAAQPAGLPGMVLSWVANRPGGFVAHETAVIDRLVPRVALTCYRVTLLQVAENLLDAYVGADAGRRILAGQIARGAATELLAVVMLADFRGYTRLADDTPAETLLAGLNDYLGTLTETIEGHGGQVLKFMGDGLLAIFSLEGHDAPQVCRDAIAAARAAIAGNAALSATRTAEGLPDMDLDIALHLGPLMYGNVGSSGRLDFTVIGPAVNEAARIEALCEPLGEHLLMSESFAQVHGVGLRSLGQHTLRGVTRPQELFALPED